MSAPLHLDGIYFGMPDDEYHADPALGSTDLKEIAIDPVDWQYDRLYAEEREDTPAMLFGRALHCRVLEGKETFATKFYSALAPEPNALRTMADMRGWLKTRSLKISGTKDELATRVRESDPDVLIWDDLVAAHARANEGRSLLTERQFVQVETAAAWMQDDGLLGQAMDDGCFQYGAPEVSIFYTDNGVRLKARIDYLLGHAIIDLKSFSTMYKEVPGKAISRAVVRQRYDLQAAAYVRAWQAGRKLVAQDRVYGADLKLRELIMSVYSRAEPIWIWVFLKTVSAPQPFVRQFDQQDLVFQVATSTIERAIATYRTMVDEFGADNKWPPRNAPETLASEDFPSWFTDQ